jgi:hypothetical protein
MRSTTGSGLSEIEHMVLLPAECFVYSSSWASVEFSTSIVFAERFIEAVPSPRPAAPPNQSGADNAVARPQ